MDFSRLQISEYEANSFSSRVSTRKRLTRVFAVTLGSTRLATAHTATKNTTGASSDSSIGASPAESSAGSSTFSSLIRSNCDSFAAMNAASTVTNWFASCVALSGSDTSGIRNVGLLVSASGSQSASLCVMFDEVFEKTREA